MWTGHGAAVHTQARHSGFLPRPLYTPAFSQSLNPLSLSQTWDYFKTTENTHNTLYLSYHAGNADLLCLALTDTAT